MCGAGTVRLIVSVGAPTFLTDGANYSAEVMIGEGKWQVLTLNWRSCQGKDGVKTCH